MIQVKIIIKTFSICPPPYSDINIIADKGLFFKEIILKKEGKINLI